MNGTDIIKLAADLTVGAISADAIKEQFGEGVLSSVLAIAGGSVAGAVTHGLLNAIDKETGIVSDVGGVVDDVIDTFKFW